MAMAQVQLRNMLPRLTFASARRREPERPPRRLAVDRDSWTSARHFAPFGFAYFAAMADAIVIFAAAYCANVAYRVFAFGYIPRFDSVALVGFAVALLVVGSGLQRGEYSLQSYLRKDPARSRAPSASGTWCSWWCWRSVSRPRRRRILPRGRSTICSISFGYVGPGDERAGWSSTSPTFDARIIA